MKFLFCSLLALVALTSCEPPPVVRKQAGVDSVTFNGAEQTPLVKEFVGKKVTDIVCTDSEMVFTFEDGSRMRLSSDSYRHSAGLKIERAQNTKVESE